VTAFVTCTHTPTVWYSGPLYLHIYQTYTLAIEQTHNFIITAFYVPVQIDNIIRNTTTVISINDYMTPCNMHITMYNESYTLQRNSDKLASRYIGTNNIKYAAASTGFLADSCSTYIFIYTIRISVYLAHTWTSLFPNFRWLSRLIKNECANSYRTTSVKIPLLA